MTAGTAYAVAQTLQDLDKVKQLKKEKYEGTKESLLGSCIKKKQSTEEEMLDTLKFPYNRYQNYLCSIL